MGIATFKSRVRSGAPLAGTFIKTPAHEVVEVMAKSGLDFICLDAEHAPFDRGRLDVCLALSRALDFPTLVRVASGDDDKILAALDSGATGVVVPHVDCKAKAERIARAAHFGHGGRGFAGSTRWAGLATRSMTEVLAQDDETVVFAQIEEPEGVEAASDIAAVPGIDGLFAGPADLSVCYGVTDLNAPVVREAMAHAATAAKAHNKAFMTFAGHSDHCAALADLGVTIFFVASEHAFMLSEARRTAKAIHALK